MAEVGQHLLTLHHLLLVRHADPRRGVSTLTRFARKRTREYFHEAQSGIAGPASVARSFEGAASALGRPDILVANAGVGLPGMPVAEMDDATFEPVIRTDLMGPLYCARAFIKARGDRRWAHRRRRLRRGTSADAIAPGLRSQVNMDPSGVPLSRWREKVSARSADG
jgi:NAD(P)-dependent dehydrogenase (short-subunit alcohol dehydrogenase family)